MTDLSDFDIDPARAVPPPPPPPPPQPPRRSPVPLIAGAVVVAALGIAAYLWFGRPAAPDTITTETTTPAPAPPARPRSDDVEPITVPLDQSDAVVRELVAALSSHPRVAAWLTTNGLIRNFVVVVENISSGSNPSRHVRVLRPAGPFRVIEADDETRIDPRSYQRYDGIADAAASIDAAGAARLYARLKPRIEEAYADLGRQEPFDRALERAIVALLQVPVVTADVGLEPTGATQYRYTNPRLEHLSSAQRQLLRMGPRNVGVIQGKLREIAMALGLRL